MTSYEDVYDAFLSKIDDVELFFPFQNETEDEYEARLNSVLIGLLNVAVSKFFFSKTKLDKNNLVETFAYNLRTVEIEILSLLMLKEYYRKKLNFLVQLRHSFSDKDWKMNDKSNQMNQYRQLIKDADSEIKLLINSNSFIADDGSIEDWTTSE
jgi:hypothetical protein